MGGERFDRTFNEALYNAEFLPPAKVWQGIEAELDENNRRKIVFYRNLAAGFAILLAASSLIFMNENRTNRIESFTEQTKPATNNEVATPVDSVEFDNDAKSNMNNDIQYTEIDQEKISNSKTIAYQKSHIELVESTNNVAEISNTKITKLQTETINSAPDTAKTDALMPLSGLDKAVLPVSPERYQLSPSWVNFERQKIISENDYKTTRSFTPEEWQLGARVTPVFAYRDITGASESSGYNSQDFFNTNEKGMLAIAGGINVHCKLSDKLMLQSGLNYSVMGQTISNLNVYESKSARAWYTNASNLVSNTAMASNSIGNIVAIQSLYLSNGAALENADAMYSDNEVVQTEDIDSYTADVMQRFQYLEIPLVLRYTIANTDAMNMYLLGGLNTHFLVGNDVYLIVNELRDNIGETEGVRSINYGTTLGAAFQFTMADNLYFNIEPTVKYFLNSINKSNNYATSHPYSFGLYTGVTYAF